MVNKLAMNLDIREYLRINPISVHPLTLSDDETDCFLYFNEDGKPYESGNSYIAYTQKQVFNGIISSIFKDWVEIDSSGNLRLRYDYIDESIICEKTGENNIICEKTGEDKEIVICGTSIDVVDSNIKIVWEDT